MKNLDEPKVIDHDPRAKMRSVPMSATRRIVCFVVGVGFLFLALLSLIAAAEGSKPGLMFMTMCGFGFGGLVLIVSALAPNFTLAREDLDRRRHR